MLNEVFEIESGKWGYRSDGIIQEYYPGLSGFVSMTKEQAEFFLYQTEYTEDILTVTRAQAKLALLHVGKLKDIENFIAQIPEGTLKDTLMIEWNDRLTFESNNTVLVSLAFQLGITPDELRAIFVLAQSL